MGAGRDGDSNGVLQDSKGVLSGPYRACLVDIVSEGLRYKPDDVSVEAYFAEQLEPVLSRLAADLMDSSPEDPVAFVQEWVDKEECRLADAAPGNSAARAGPAPPCPLVHMAAWRDRTRRHEVELELRQLRRRVTVVETALRKAPFGDRAIAAMSAESEAELIELFASCRVVTSSKGMLEEKAAGTTLVDERQTAELEHKATNTEPLFEHRSTSTSLVDDSRRAPLEHKASNTEPLFAHGSTNTDPADGSYKAPAEHKATNTVPLAQDRATNTTLTDESGQVSMEHKATSTTPAAEHKDVATSSLDESCASGLEDKARDTNFVGRRRSTDVGKNPRALDALGVVLEALHSRGVTSVSAAFSYFGPTNMDGSFVETTELVSALDSLNVLQPDQVALLAGGLDPRGRGHVAYRDFRAAVVSFLASSQEYHAGLEQREFTGILQRLHQQVRAQGRSVGEALAGRELQGDEVQEGADFVAALKSLRLGLSGKEAAQILETLSAWDSPSTPLSSTGGRPPHEPVVSPDGRVMLPAFERIVQWCYMQEDVRSWASTTFARIHKQVTQRYLEAWARERADAPVRRHLSYSGFSALIADTLPSAPAAEISALWCVLPKDDDEGGSLVDLEEFLRWLLPSAAAPSQVTTPVSSRRRRPTCNTPS
mmetsp:Transcript_23401/g.66717  ORF Transcript_23401/g.66717 Transcript_23401/m.66717 type:complete len:655 (+) Transcript_23401:105-2069(+)